MDKTDDRIKSIDEQISKIVDSSQYKSLQIRSREVGEQRIFDNFNVRIKTLKLQKQKIMNEICKEKPIVTQPICIQTQDTAKHPENNAKKRALMPNLNATQVLSTIVNLSEIRSDLPKTESVDSNDIQELSPLMGQTLNQKAQNSIEDVLNEVVKLPEKTQSDRQENSEGKLDTQGAQIEEPKVSQPISTRPKMPARARAIKARAKPKPKRKEEKKVQLDPLAQLESELKNTSNESQSIGSETKPEVIQEKQDTKTQDNMLDDLDLEDLI